MAGSGDVSQKISDESVLEKTGKSWAEWFALLDQFDVAANGHTAAARHLGDAHGASAWWAQSIAIRYELEHGLREPGERSRGFGLSVQRTIAVPAAKAFAAWSSAEELDRWFTTGASVDFREGGRYSDDTGDMGEFRRIIPQQRIRFTWDNPDHGPGSVVDVEFTPKDPSKTTVRLTHEKLASRDQVDDLKEGWTWAMDSLKSYLTGGSGIPFETWQAERRV